MRCRLHAFEPHSRANGPGIRAVVWFQGCSLGCPGCFNPATHAAAGGVDADTEELAARLVALRAATRDPIEGVTISGGEPLEQPAALLDLLGRLEGTGLGTILFTGFTGRELEALPLGPAVLARVDAAIVGRYVAARHLGRGLLGSSNQRIVLVTARYCLADFERVPVREAIIRGGTVTWTGVR